MTLVGPRGLRRICEGLLAIAQGLPFPLRYLELNNELFDGMQEISFGFFFLSSCRGVNGMPCVSYSV